MARRKYPKFWNYQDWENKKEEKRRQDYLDRMELLKKEQEDKQDLKQKENKDNLNSDITLEKTETKKENSFEIEEKIKQTSYFDVFPDGIEEKDKNNNRGRKSDFKRISEYLIKEDEICQNAYLVPEGCFKEKSLDEVIEYIELLGSGEEKVNVVVEYKGHKFYSLLDNKDSCYRKVYGLDYKQYLKNVEDEREM